MELTNAANKYDWLGLTNTGEIHLWDLDRCISYLSFSECTQIRLKGDGTAAQKKEMVYNQLIRLVASQPKKKIIPEASGENPDYSRVVYSLRLFQYLLERAFVGLKVPPSLIIAPSDSFEEYVSRENAVFYQYLLSLVQVIYKP
jgi:hypothetical protein